MTTAILAGRPLRPVSYEGPDCFEAVGLDFGKDASAPFEVLVLVRRRAPRPQDFRDAWRRRNTGRPAPLLLLVRDGVTT